jgi:hypothetical protein
MNWLPVIQRCRKAGERLKQALDSFNIEEIVADTVKYDAVYLSLDNARAETISIMWQTRIWPKKEPLLIFYQGNCCYTDIA